MSYASQILNQINDYENNVGPGEQMIDYNATKETARALMNAVDRDEEGMMDEDPMEDTEMSIGFIDRNRGVN